MRFYTAHVRHGGLDPDRDLVLVKEGFSWPAFLFSVPWALFARLWLAALVVALAMAAVEWVAYLIELDPATRAVLSTGVLLGFGWMANDLRRHRLERAGFVFQGVVAAETRDDALQRFLDNAPELARELALTVRP